MADIKTHIRELSVAIGIKYALEPSINIKRLFCGINFYQAAKDIVSNDISCAKNILSINEFDTELKLILHNGLKLGKYIVDKFNIKTIYSILWCGWDLQKDDPTDLIINNIRFSLKEDSFILENMGLYKFLSLTTNKTFKRGLHVFKYFAKDEYDEWFSYSINKAYEIADGWTIKNNRYESSIQTSNNNLIFIFKDLIKNNIAKSIISKTSSIDTYEKLTTNIIREKVFAKWIKDILIYDKEYINLKKKCSEVAGENLCNYIKSNLKQDGISRFLQIREFEYYYAKSTLTETIVLKVPSFKDFSKHIQIESVTYSVPKSQLNIVTTIKNNQTNSLLNIRNECRFSHGQFNGTPEAKMYYDGNLKVIYEKV